MKQSGMDLRFIIALKSIIYSILSAAIADHKPEFVLSIKTRSGFFYASQYSVFLHRS
jgi:hypothetical protein